MNINLTQINSWASFSYSVIFTESLSLVTKQVSFTRRAKLLLSQMSYFYSN